MAYRRLLPASDAFYITYARPLHTNSGCRKIETHEKWPIVYWKEYFDVEAGIVFSIHFTIKKRTMTCRVVGGARTVDGQAECRKDQMLGRHVLGRKVE